MALEERVARLEGIVEEIRSRLDDLNARMSSLEARMQTQFLWLLGTMLGILIPMWVSIILVVLLRP